MSDTLKQAIQRFVAVLIATVASGAVALLTSDQARDLINAAAGGNSLLAALILALLPPIIAAIGKYADGATVKAPLVGGETRGARRERVATGEEPGLFG